MADIVDTWVSNAMKTIYFCLPRYQLYCSSLFTHGYSYVYLFLSLSWHILYKTSFFATPFILNPIWSDWRVHLVDDRDSSSQDWCVPSSFMRYFLTSLLVGCRCIDSLVFLLPSFHQLGSLMSGSFSSSSLVVALFVWNDGIAIYLAENPRLRRSQRLSCYMEVDTCMSTIAISSTSETGFYDSCTSGLCSRKYFSCFR